jgi:F0F1-type ATP synthase membrane subunit b/b'
MEKFKDFIAKYWFLTSIIALAVMYYFLGAKGRRIEQLVSELARQKLENEIGDINARRAESKEGFNEANQKYEDLKRRHGALLDKLGIRLGSGTDKPDAP